MILRLASFVTHSKVCSSHSTEKWKQFCPYVLKAWNKQFCSSGQDSPNLRQLKDSQRCEIKCCRAWELSSLDRSASSSSGSRFRGAFTGQQTVKDLVDVSVNIIRAPAAAQVSRWRRYPKNDHVGCCALYGACSVQGEPKIAAAQLLMGACRY